MSVEQHRRTNRETLAEAFSLEKQAAGAIAGRLHLIPLHERQETETVKLTFASFGVVGACGQTGRLYIERTALGSPTLPITAVDLVEPTKRGIEFPDSVKFSSDLASILQRKDRPEAFILATTNPIDKLLETFRDNLDDRHITLILPQNGVDVVPKAQEILKGKNVTLIRASLFTPVDTEPDGKIKYPEDKLRIGLSLVRPEGDIADPEKEKELQKAVETFRRGGFDAKIFENYVSMEWTKLVLNAVGITGGIVGISPKEVYNDHALYLLETQALHDRLRILEAAGIKLEHIPWGGAALLPTYDSLPGLIRKSHLAQFLYGQKVIAGRGNKPSSVGINIQKGTPTEGITYLEPFVKLGETVGLRSIVDEAMIEIIQGNYTFITRRKNDVDTQERKIDLADFSLEERRTLLFETIRKLSQKPPTRLDRLEGRIFAEGAKRFLRYRIIDPRNYRERTAEVLHPKNAEEKPGEVVEGLNHGDMSDSIHGMELNFTIDDIAHAYGMDTFWHYDRTRGKKYTRLYAWVEAKVTAATGMRTYHILREKDFEYYRTHRGAIEGKAPEEYSGPSYRKIRERLKKEGGIFLIAPEATRTLTGELNRAQPAGLFLETKDFKERGVYLPVGLVPTSIKVPYPERRSLAQKAKRFLAKTEIRVGKPVTYAEIIQDMTIVNEGIKAVNNQRGENEQLELMTISDMMMLYIARVLPPQYWGYYKEYVQFMPKNNGNAPLAT